MSGIHTFELKDILIHMKKSAEKGQALTELVVCLIPIILIFSGVILIAVLGRANVQNTIQARSQAELGRQTEKEEPMQISDWDYGKDRIPYTSDDQPLTNARFYLAAGDFDTEKDTVPGKYTENVDLQNVFDGGYLSNLPGRVNFTQAANLTGAKLTVRDTLSKNKMQFFARMFQIHLKSQNIEIKDSVFMPETKEPYYEIN